MNASDARKRARERVERRQIADARSFGGRRLGFASVEEQATMEAVERQLLGLARRAVERAR